MSKAPDHFRLPNLLAIWGPPCLWGLAILSLSGNAGSGSNTMRLMQWLLSGFPSLTYQDIEAIHWYLRKFSHMVAYGVLYLLWFRAWKRQVPHRSGLSLKLALLFSLVVALLDEGYQTFFPERTGSLADVALDMTGAGLAALLGPGVFGCNEKRRDQGKATRG